MIGSSFRAPDRLVPDVPLNPAELPIVNERPAWSRGDPGLYKPGLAGAGQRFGDWLHAPGTAAALFRSGAATLSDGLGAGLQAGAGYMDRERAIASQAQQQGFENDMALAGQALRELVANQQDKLGWAGVTNDALRINEAGRSNRAREAIDANGQKVQLYGIDTSAQTQRRGQDVDIATTNASLNQRERESQRSDSTSRYVADRAATARDYATDARYPTDEDGNPIAGAGIGSRGRGGSGAVGKVKIKGTPARDGWMSDTPATPDQELDIFALPANANPKTLVPGRVYQTARGNARWNGSGFDPL